MSAITLIINLSYILSAILFIIGIKMLGKTSSAKNGNTVSSIGMLIAVLATLIDKNILEFQYIIVGIVAGSFIGIITAKRVQMTGMPQLVALFNGFGGLASLLVGYSEFNKIQTFGLTSDVDAPLPFIIGAITLAVLIGGVTFSGSLIAYLRLAGKMGGSPTIFKCQLATNTIIAIISMLLALAVTILSDQKESFILFYFLVFFAILLGFMGTLPIGGGDMPVIISLLNSFSGLAACAAGFILLNTVLIVAGCLVGASGLILTVIMCKAMNRSIGNVLFGGFGSASKSTAQAIEGEMKPLSIEDAYYVLESASSVVFVPGYGMATAQAQHAVKELSTIMENNGTEIRFAIHPVAGRMPGHMNVLLAEADVPYEQLQEMDEVNAIMGSVDVAIIIGANDVVNPAANDDESSPIYGMPIINVSEASTVFCLKRGSGKGFSGLVNKLFYQPNTRMIYGDAKETISALAGQFES